MKSILLFPGYGSQFVGMGKELYDEFRIVQEYFEEASNCLNINFVKLCFASSDVELSKMVNAYTSLFLISSSIFALLKQEEIIPSMVAGYNDGEYAALFSGGGFSFPDGLYLLNKFCFFYQEILDEMDIEVVRITGVPTQQLEDACLKVSAYDGKVYIGIYHGPEDHIVGGNTAEVEQLRDMVGNLPDVSIEHVGQEIGLHSSLMDTVVDQFKIYLEKVDFKDLSIPLLCGMDGEEVSQGQDIKRRIVRHINGPLVFRRVIDKLADFDLILIASPADQLQKMIKKRYPEKQIVVIEKGVDIQKIKSMMIR